MTKKRTDQEINSGAEAKLLPNEDPENPQYPITDAEEEEDGTVTETSTSVSESTTVTEPPSEQGWVGGHTMQGRG